MLGCTIDREAFRGLTALPCLPHVDIGGLDVATESVGIEQWISPLVVFEPLAQAAQERRIGREPQRQRLIFGEGFGDKSRQPDSL